MRKATKKQQAQWDLEREQSLIAMELRHNAYHGKEFDVVVRWFDALSGEGMVQLSDGTSWYLNFTAIEGIDKNNHHWPREEDLPFLRSIDGRACKVALFVDGGMVLTCVLSEK